MKFLFTYSFGLIVKERSFVPCYCYPILDQLLIWSKLIGLHFGINKSFIGGIDCSWKLCDFKEISVVTASMALLEFDLSKR